MGQIRVVVFLLGAATTVLFLWSANVSMVAANEIDKPVYSSTFATPAGEALDIAVDKSGNLWIVNYVKNKVQEFNTKGELLSQFGESGSGNGQFKNPAGIAIDAEEHLWVTDSGNARVQEFDFSGKYLSQFGGSEFFTFPTGIAIDSEGNIWVASSQTSSVISEFNKEDEFLGSFGESGSGPGQLKGTFFGIAIGAEGNLFISEYGNHRIQVFDTAGKLIRQISEKGTGKGQLEFPGGIALDAKGNVWVMDGSRGEVFSGKGEFLFEFGEEGAGIGQFNRAQAIELGIGGDIWIGDLGHERVQKWREATVAEKLARMTVTQPFDGSPASASTFSTSWSALGWAGGGTPKGAEAANGWHPVDAYPTVNGAFLNSTFTDAGFGVADAVTMNTNPANAGRYFSIWLDMSTPSGARNGYELRFTDTSAGIYTATLSRWLEGVQTTLVSKSSLSLANGNSVALVDEGSSVSAWTDTGSGFAQILSGADGSFSTGKTGVEGSGNITRLKSFKAGAL